MPAAVGEAVVETKAAVLVLVEVTARIRIAGAFPVGVTLTCTTVEIMALAAFEFLVGIRIAIRTSGVTRVRSLKFLVGVVTVGNAERAPAPSRAAPPDRAAPAGSLPDWT